MKIERNGFQGDNVVPTGEFKKSCLNCDECAGLCWTFAEMRALPGVILSQRDETGTGNG